MYDIEDLMRTPEYKIAGYIEYEKKITILVHETVIAQKRIPKYIRGKEIKIQKVFCRELPLAEEQYLTCDRLTVRQ